MFFNSDLLTKRGALAQVWMASHLSSKLSKQALTSTSIPKSVQSILGQDLLPMALRLSGQLLLGIARIYSRKTKYLLDDAQETLGKVKKAFQNEGRAAVDLPEEDVGGAAGDQSGRGGRDINLRREGGDLEDMLALEFADGEWNLEKHLAAAAANKEKADKGKGKQKALTANIADITLDESFAHDGYGLGGGSDLFAGIDGGDLGFGDDLNLDFDPDFALFEGDDELNALAGGNAVAGPSGEGKKKAAASKKRAREGEDFDGSERDEDDLSVELGRDAAPHASSERALSAGPFDLDLGLEGGKNGFEGGNDMDMDFGGGFDGGEGGAQLDFGFGGGFDGGFDEQPFGAEGEREKTPTAPSLNGDDSTSLQLTPRAAAEVAARAAAEQKKGDGKGEPARKRQKALAMDKVIELDWEAGRLEGKERFKEPEFLPSSRVHLALLTASTASSALLPRPLPKENKSATALELFAPPGLLAPELQDLFKMPTRREQIKLEGRERNKDAERDVEVGRRAMSVVSNLSHHRQGGPDAFGGGENGDVTFDLGAGAGEDFGGGFDQHFDFDLGADGLPEGGAEGGFVEEDGDIFKTPTSKRASKKQKTTHGGEREGSIFDNNDGLATPARSVLSALAKDDLPQYQSEGPLAVFDDVSSGSTVAGSVAGTESQTQSQSQAQASQSLGTTEEGAAAGMSETLTQKSGSISLRSRNTRKAVTVLKGELLREESSRATPVEGEAEKEEKKLEFGKVAEKASRRAAASFFFELLVLSSADVVKLRQPTAFGEIEVRATDKLREIAV